MSETTQCPNISQLLASICRANGIRVFPYSNARAKALAERIGIAEQLQNGIGFSIRADDVYCIFYDDSAPHLESQYVVAHELGHILLGHLTKKQGTLDTDYMESEANAFASAMVVQGLAATFVPQKKNPLPVRPTPRAAKRSRPSPEQSNPPSL